MPYTLKEAISNWKNPYLGLPVGSDLKDLKDDDIVSTINTTIKPVEKEDSTIEIEKNELVFLPTGELFKATGKTHAKGGTPVNIPEGSFIFSDYKKLALNKDDKEAFKFKEGGSFTKENNTPAKILSREIDIKHHNKMLAILKSESHDDISKTSARLMLEKYLPKIGQVAFIQEEKKGFPQGVPSFSEGTAPISPDLSFMEKQYKMGGMYRKYQDGGSAPSWYKPFLTAKSPKGYTTTTGQDSRYNDVVPPNSYADLERWQKEAGRPFTGLQDYQQFIYNTQNAQAPQNIDAMWNKFGPTNKGTNLEGFADNYMGARTTYLEGLRIPGQPVRTGFTPPEMIMGNPQMPNIPQTYVPQNGPEVPESFTPNTSQYYNEVQRTPLQDVVLGNDLYNTLNVSRVNPMRSQQSFTPLTLERVNSQPFMNNINNQVSSANSISQVMNPYQAAAYGSKNLGQALDKSSEVLGNVYNQNLQISNSENQYNNQGINSTASQNVGLNQQYYDQVQKSDANYNNTKDVLRNKAVQTFVNQSAENEDLRYRLDSAETFGSAWVDPATNTPVDREQLAKEAKENNVSIDKYAESKGYKSKAMAPVFFNPYKRRVEHTGIQFDFNKLPQNSTGMSPDQFKAITKDLTDSQTKAYMYYLAKVNKNPYRN